MVMFRRGSQDMDPRSRNRREGWERQGEDGSDQRGGDGLGTNGTWGRQRQSNGAVGDERHRGGISAHRGINKTSEDDLIEGSGAAVTVERTGIEYVRRSVLESFGGSRHVNSYARSLCKRTHPSLPHVS